MKLVPAHATVNLSGARAYAPLLVDPEHPEIAELIQGGLVVRDDTETAEKPSEELLEGPAGVSEEPVVLESGHAGVSPDPDPEEGTES